LPEFSRPTVTYGMRTSFPRDGRDEHTGESRATGAVVRG
jgi:hypothetical protein